MCVLEAIADFGRRVLPNPPRSLDLTPPVLSPAWCLERGPTSTIINGKRSAPEAKRKKSKAHLFQGGAECRQTWRLSVKNKYAYSSVVGKFFAVFTRVTCKRNEAKIGGIAFWLWMYSEPRENSTAEEAATLVKGLATLQRFTLAASEVKTYANHIV